MALKYIYTLILIAGFGTKGYLQNITILPYLQDASPHSINILWETDGDNESIVEWGENEELTFSSFGIAYTSEGDFKVHEVLLENLKPATKYFYRVKTGTAESAVYHFKTPAHHNDLESFRIVAMSDMQRDGSHPDKFREIVEDGIIDFLTEKEGSDLVDNLALIMIPGDLVTNGNDFNSWKNSFFAPAQKLFPFIPVYPVLGNHEINTPYYFAYFKLPENGTPGFEEHWWYKDYGNIRIIGLDSNSPYTNEEQLTWLDELLINTCYADSIDFVFAQLHHPHKSELWTPGELDYTGSVIDLLENFTSDCDKLSIHFFGHTHAYSRGASRDHKHLWINVATAGGAIDNWGEFPNFDYDEFSVSQDDYGFVIVEITNNEDPKLTIKRVSRGDQDLIIDNEITDSITISLHGKIVDAPTPKFPINEEIAPECAVLKASEFSSPDPNALHGQSHWQVSTYENGFNEPVADSWRNYENWYFEVNTQEGDDLSDEYIPSLDENETYIWRVRYRDRELNWSDWSAPVSFKTGLSISTPNILLNPGAEFDLENWEIVEGVVEALKSKECDGTEPHSGDKYFIVGGLCEHSDVARLIQDVDVSTKSDSIDAGALKANFGGYLSDYIGQDVPEMKLIFIDHQGTQIEESEVLSNITNSWVLVSSWTEIPSLTRTIRVELKGTKNSGTDNDSYFDDLFLKIGTGEYDCGITSSYQSPALPFIPEINISPNPMNDHSVITLPENIQGPVSVQMININGAKVNPVFHHNGNSILLDNTNLEPGVFLVWVKQRNKILGKGKLIVSEN